MSKQIKPGMLCIVRGLKGNARYPEFCTEGRIVEVLRLAQSNEIFENLEGPNIRFVPSNNGAIHWVVTSSSPLSWQDCLCKERVVDDMYLIPISDPDIELTTEEIKELETI
jgi:hypothetical protein